MMIDPEAIDSFEKWFQQRLDRYEQVVRMNPNDDLTWARYTEAARILTKFQWFLAERDDEDGND